MFLDEVADLIEEGIMNCKDPLLIENIANMLGISIEYVGNKPGWFEFDWINKDE